MKKLRTHMWLCLALGVFQLVAMAMMYYVMVVEMNQSSSGYYLPKEVVRVGIINGGFCTAYFLIVLYKAIKYAPSKT